MTSQMSEKCSWDENLQTTNAGKLLDYFWSFKKGSLETTNHLKVWFDCSQTVVSKIEPPPPLRFISSLKIIETRTAKSINSIPRTSHVVLFVFCLCCDGINNILFSKTLWFKVNCKIDFL